MERIIDWLWYEKRAKSLNYTNTEYDPIASLLEMNSRNDPVIFKLRALLESKAK